MFRLKSLDQDVMDLIHPPMTGKPKTIAATPEDLDKTPAEFLAKQPSPFTHMVCAAAVFHQDRLLLLQRAAHESYPGHWELPGGMAEPGDKTIRDAVARELREETGLESNNIVAQILPAETFETGWGQREKKWLKACFIVDIGGGSKGVLDDKSVNTEVGRELTIGKLDMPAVELNINEHQQHIWVTEDELQAEEHEGVKLQFIAEEQAATLRMAFRMHKATPTTTEPETAESVTL